MDWVGLEEVEVLARLLRKGGAIPEFSDATEKGIHRDLFVVVDND